MNDKFVYLVAVAVGLMVGFFVGYGVAGVKSGVVHGESTKILSANGAKIEREKNGIAVLILPVNSIEKPKLKGDEVKIVLKNKGV